jgi:hypothetical protein
MSSKVLLKYLESYGLTFDNIKISKVTRSGKEIEISAEDFLCGLVSAIRKRPVKIINDTFPVSYRISNAEMEMSISPERFRAGMRDILDFGIELSSLSDVTGLGKILDNNTFVMLRYATVMSEIGIAYDTSFTRFYNAAKDRDVLVGAYIYVESPWKFNCYEIIKSFKDRGVRLDFPLSIDYADDIVVDDTVINKVTEVNAILDAAHIFHTVTSKYANVRQGVMSVTYPDYISEPGVIPLRVLKGLGSISSGSGNILRAYHADDKYVYLTCKKGMIYDIKMRKRKLHRYKP